MMPAIARFRELVVLSVLGVASALSAPLGAAVVAPRLPFVPNTGQYPPDVRFFAGDGRATVAVRAGAIEYRIGRRGDTLTETPGNPGPANVWPRGLRPAETRFSDLRGADPGRWQHDQPTWAAIDLGEIDNGIRLELAQGAAGIEKIFRIAPHAAPERIAVAFREPHGLAILPDGALVVAPAGANEAHRFSAPVAWQDVDGERVPVDVAYRLLPGGGYGFSVAAYRSDLALVIDPTLVASTLLGGDGKDEVVKVAVDRDGNIVVAGNTQVPYKATDAPFPTVPGGYDTTINGGAGSFDVFVARFDPELKRLLAMTFVGSTRDDFLSSLVLGTDGSVWIAGYTAYDPDFPTTANAYQRSGPRNAGGFVTHLSASLSTLLASTVLDVAPYTWLSFHDLALDAAGNVFAAGGIDGSGLPGPGYKTTHTRWSDGLVVKFDAGLTKLLAATYLGGIAAENVRALAIDGSGRVYVTGEVAASQSPQDGGLRYDFPTTPGTWLPTGTGCNASFVTRFDNNLSQIQASTFIGVPGSSGTRCGFTPDYGNTSTRDILITPGGKIYVAGDIDAGGLPVTGGVQPTFMKANGFHMAAPFVLRMDADLARVEAATYFAGRSWYDHAVQLALNGDGNVVLAGLAGSTDFPVTIDAFQVALNQGVYSYDTRDGFVAVFGPNLDRLVYATLIGGTRGETLNGVAVANNNDMIVVGLTTGVWDPKQNFPTTDGAFDRTAPDWAADGYVARLRVPEVLSVSVTGTRQMLTGTEADFELTYRNTMRFAANNAVVVVDIPAGLEFVEGSPGWQFYADGRCTNQGFWVIPTIAPQGGEGKLRFRMRVPPGTPNIDFEITARISAANAPEPLFDVAPYVDYVGIEEASTTTLTAAQAAAARTGDPTVAALYDYALANGYVDTGTAVRTLFTDGTSALRWYLVAASDGAIAILDAMGGKAWVEVWRPDGLTLFDRSSGFTWNRATGSLEYFDTLPKARALAPGDGPTPKVLYGAGSRCGFNCMVTLIPDMAFGKVHELYSYLKLTLDCIKCAKAAKGGKATTADGVEACSKCAAKIAEKIDKENIKKKIPGLGDVVTIVNRFSRCLNECTEDPNRYVCTQDRFDCTCFGNWVSNGLGVCRTACNRTTGTYAAMSSSTWCTADSVCVASRCNQVSADSCCVKETEVCPPNSTCGSTPVRNRTARDPNAKLADRYGALPAGTRIRYTLQYENVGGGDAFDVFVIDQLSEQFDGSSVQVEDGGSWDAGSRVLHWKIGTVAPKGHGEVHFSAALKTTLAEGTEATNQAEVYFPSALEITPTNVVLHVVRSVAANDQAVAAVSGRATPVTLTGQGPGSLAYQLASAPGFGTLTGNAPNLSYTPAAGFTGQDRFTFTVTSGGRTSSPGQITVDVAVDTTDRTAPTVLDVTPAAGAVNVAFASGEFKPGYFAPLIAATFDKEIDPASVTTGNFGVDGVGGNVAYDAGTRTVRFWPNAALRAGQTYTARATGLKDRNGNAMAAPYTWTFTMASATAPSASPPTAVTGAASAVTAHSASLAGTAVANGSATSVAFQFGPTTTYGASAPGVPDTLPAGAAATPITATIAGLACATTYHFRLIAASAGGNASGSDATFTTAACAVEPNYTGLWWYPVEAGWGINFAHQGDIVFATWFTYDTAGAPWWLIGVMSRSADGFAGPVSRVSGLAFSAVPWDSARVSEDVIGAMNVRFTSASAGTLSYAVNGTTQTKPISRQVFGPLPTCAWGARADLATATNFTDLWWNAKEPGWGVNFSHQGDVVFATWFTYDTAGKPWWLIAELRRGSGFTYSGPVATVSGSPFGAPFDAGRIVETPVGEATVTFSSGNAAAFRYTVDGTTQAKLITRQVFVPPGTACGN